MATTSTTRAGAAGAGNRSPETSRFLQFTVPEGVDNAKAVVEADPTGESMTTQRLWPGTYRIEVHDRAGPPGNHMPVKATFYNGAGEPGS